jgi:hypothetical protein
LPIAAAIFVAILGAEALNAEEPGSNLSPQALRRKPFAGLIEPKPASLIWRSPLSMHRRQSTAM